MIGHFSKFLVFILALATAGAQVVCGCPAKTAMRQAEVEPVSSCTENLECCKKAKPPVERQEPCEKCNIKHPLQQAMPQEKVGVEIGQLAVCDFAVIAQVGLVDVAGAQQERAEGTPAPPLLFDLFHVHSLLLN